jgi:hypothetical protein
MNVSYGCGSSQDHSRGLRAIRFLPFNGLKFDGRAMAHVTSVFTGAGLGDRHLPGP